MTKKTHTLFFRQHSEAESRLCFFDGNTELAKTSEVMKKGTTFEALMIDIARSLPLSDIDKNENKKTDVSTFGDKEAWMKAWTDTDFTTNGVPLHIDSPFSFLQNLSVDQRKEIYIQYLQQNFPATAVDTNPLFQALKAASPADLDTPEFQKKRKSFLALEKEMHNTSASGMVSETNFNNETELKDATYEELLNKYIDPITDAFRDNAFEEFAQLRDKYPMLSTTILEDPSALELAIKSEKSPFVAALHLDVFDEGDLSEMNRIYNEKKKDQTQVVSEASKKQEAIKNRINANENKSFKEHIYEQFSGMDNWKKLLVIGLGSALVLRTVLKKDKKWYNYLAMGGMGLAGFYLLGGRESVEGTVFGKGFAAAETQVKKGFNSLDAKMSGLEGVSGHPEIKESDLQEYAKYFMETAKEDLGSEIESMGYLSGISIDRVAESFSLNAGGRGGVLNLDRNSPLSAEVNRMFSSAGGKVLSKLKEKNAVLSDGMSHVFYMLGGSESVAEYKAVEETCKDLGVTYDDIPDDDPARQKYEQLAIRGIELAKTKYKGKNWFDIISTLNK